MRAAAAGGYQYDATRMRGFSLTHLSGTGCRGASGDIPFMPITVPVTTSPAADAKNEIYGADFDHANETATAGYYQVQAVVRHQRRADGRRRAAGIGRFTYPAGQPATMLVRTSDSQVGSSDAHVEVDNAARTITGSVTSGNFCGYIGTVNRRSYYTLYFVGRVRPAIRGDGHVEERRGQPDATTADGGTTYGTNGYPEPGIGSGAYVTFDTSAGSVVHVRVGISYVSLANARANLAPRFRAAHDVRRRARRAPRDAWNTWLRRIDDRRRHAGRAPHLLHRAVSRVAAHEPVQRRQRRVRGLRSAGAHVAAPQRAQYANFSGWDVYRSQLQLVTLLDPAIASDMAQSLLNQATQNNGVWDRWTHNTGATHVMEGDAAAQSVPSIVAFGGTDFDMKARVRVALKPRRRCRRRTTSSREGCNVACPGQRPSLDKWLTHSLHPDACRTRGAAPARRSRTSPPTSRSRSSRRRLGDDEGGRGVPARSGYWRNIFNPEATPDRGYIQNRNEDGTWPRFNPSSSNGFAEGSSAQSTRG